MAALPSPTQVAGNHNAIYEAYYHQVDPNGTGIIQALDAARFLKKSKLSDVILSKVWDLSDPSGRGYLDKGGLFVALKLVALAQAGKEIAMSNINSETPPPKLGELPKVPPMVPPPPASDWSVKPAERDKYNQLFESLQPSKGLIPGNKVKGVLMESKLPLPTLGKIWDLADQDKDGMLDRHEFTVAMHLVYKALEKHTIPPVLPPELRAGSGGGAPPRPPSRPPSRPHSPSPTRPPPMVHHMPVHHVPPPHHAPIPIKPPPPAVSQPPLIPGLSGPATTIMDSQVTTTTSAKPWVVTPAEKQQYDALFTQADVDMDGFVSGMEIKDTFLQSGLPQPCLAHIWGLCDWDSSGKLSSDQFALAMWMVQRRLRGLEPPAALAPDMIPPSARPSGQLQPELSLGPQATPEMEALARDMEGLARERLTLEAEVSSKEHTIRVKTSEANSLQSELDTLAATLKQLENQRGEAQKRLNDLQAQVEKLRVQATAQEEAVRGAESETATRRETAAGLRRSEQQLADELKTHNATVESLNGELQRSVLAISQANVKMTHLEEQEQQTEEALAAVETALGGGTAPAPQHLSLQPPLSQQGLQRLVQGTTPSVDHNGKSPDQEFGSMNGPGQGGFSSDPFKDDPFNKSGKSDPFAATFPASKPSDGFASDPFASNFGSSTPDPFGGDAFNGSQDNKKPDDNKDPFGCDPFAILHAPTRDGPSPSPSPTPSLPPKKHKQPPPRPAPPRPHQPASAHFNADFSNFSNKPPVKVSTVPRATPLKSKAGMDFTEDPFRDYRYEDPFNLDDPFADVADGNEPRTERPARDAFGTRVDTSKNSGFAAFETDDFFSTSSGMKAFEKNNNDAFNGRQSAPLPSDDPFVKSGRASAPVNNNQSWATWGGSAEAWPADNWSAPSPAPDLARPKDKRATKEKEPSKEKLKKEKSPKPGNRYAKTISQAVFGGSLSRHKKGASNNNNTSNNNNNSGSISTGMQGIPSEEQQLAWAAAEGRRLEEERRARRDKEDRELQIAMALSNLTCHDDLP